MFFPYFLQQSGNQRGTAWGEQPRQANNLLGANLTPADRHGGSVQVRRLAHNRPQIMFCS